MKLARPQNKDISIVMPCLNEIKTVGECVDVAYKYIKDHNLNGEVIVVDNGSTDGSGAEAKAHGAIVIKEKRKGYGSAIRKGLKYISGAVVVIGDCDTTYDFSDLDGFYYMIADGACDMVMGNRFAHKMEQGAMPLSHNLGVKFLSLCGRLAFKTDVYDFHSGLRSISREALEKARFGTIGMEFATEMIAEASRLGFKIDQTPVDLKTCRYERKSKLHTIRDGMRHLTYIIREAKNHRNGRK
ncbi:MAG: glycosyltransferase family 2 protein [Lachnospiraceae bacterium]|nr:glycosyltransferase family 2 protein [Lachnospiraceae bacterium]